MLLIVVAISLISLKELDAVCPQVCLDHLNEKFCVVHDDRRNHVYDNIPYTIRGVIQCPTWPIRQKFNMTKYT